MAKRAGFQKMISDALAGSIDLIITKSVSRFARNTVDSLSTIRMLKEKGIEVYFEKENIWTFDGKGELLLTIMSSLAESESKSISDNIKWAVTKKFEQGKFSLPYKRFLGYDRGPNGEPVINEKEAETVRMIYSEYLMGFSPLTIAGHLTSKGIPTPSGRAKEWSSTTIESILRNEKYAGNAVLQKTFCQDFLTKKIVKNTGQMTQYHVKGSHPAIISEEEFDLVQEEIQRRHSKQKVGYSSSIFSGRIYCGECGGVYGSKVHHSTDKYRKVVYRCNGRYKDGKRVCKTPLIEEEEIKAGFVKAVNQLESQKDEVIENIQEVKRVVLATDELEKDKANLEVQLDVLKEKWNRLCASGPISDTAATASLQFEYTEALKRHKNLEKTIQSKITRSIELDKFCEDFRAMDGEVSEFSEKLWLTLLDHVTVYSKEHLEYTFRNGETVKV